MLDKQVCFDGIRFGANVLVVDSGCGIVAMSILLIWVKILR